MSSIPPTGARSPHIETDSKEEETESTPFRSASIAQVLASAQRATTNTMPAFHAESDVTKADPIETARWLSLSADSSSAPAVIKKPPHKPFEDFLKENGIDEPLRRVAIAYAFDPYRDTDQAIKILRFMLQSESAEGFETVFLTVIGEAIKKNKKFWGEKHKPRDFAETPAESSRVRLTTSILPKDMLEKIGKAPSDSGAGAGRG